MIVKVEYDSDIQFKTLSVLVQSFENGTINIDKFMFWVLKTFDPGTSIILHKLNEE